MTFLVVQFVKKCNRIPFFLGRHHRKLTKEFLLQNRKIPHLAKKMFPSISQEIEDIKNHIIPHFKGNLIVNDLFFCFEALWRKILPLDLKTPVYFFSPHPLLINIWKKGLTKAIWVDKKWACFWQISLHINIKQNGDLDFNPEFSS